MEKERQVKQKNFNVSPTLTHSLSLTHSRILTHHGCGVIWQGARCVGKLREVRVEAVNRFNSSHQQPAHLLLRHLHVVHHHLIGQVTAELSFMYLLIQQRLHTNTHMHTRITKWQVVYLIFFVLFFYMRHMCWHFLNSMQITHNTIKFLNPLTQITSD